MCSTYKNHKKRKIIGRSQLDFWSNNPLHSFNVTWALISVTLVQNDFWYIAWIYDWNNLRQLQKLDCIGKSQKLRMMSNNLKQSYKRLNLTHGQQYGHTSGKLRKKIVLLSLWSSGRAWKKIRFWFYYKILSKTKKMQKLSRWLSVTRET